MSRSKHRSARSAPEISVADGGTEILVAEGLIPRSRPEHRPLDLKLDVGTINCLVGRNFTGKSAWLGAMAGLEPPAAGSLEIMAADVWSLEPEAWRLLRTNVAFITADAPLISWLDGLSNVTLPATYHSSERESSARAQATELLEKLGYDGALDMLPAYLDRHHRSLLALARWLMLAPEMVFIDEPFELTDANSRLGMEAVLRWLAEDQGITLVISTHNLDFARKHSDTVLYADGTGLYVHPSWDSLADADPAFTEGRPDEETDHG
jgi:predicted ABC-type transport system involved in lysophospholipase L1 biosynthesis ATPase subunit